MTYDVTMLGSLPRGYRLDGYCIDTVLGQGGFGITYRAIEEQLQRYVAIKEYFPREYAMRTPSGVAPSNVGAREVFTWGLERFVGEGRTLALFRHPNITSVLRFLEANGTAYLVMEFEDGEHLGNWSNRLGEHVTEEILLHQVLVPLLDGLAKVHEKGLLHRDIKPENIIVRPDGCPVLIDFGASRQAGNFGSNLTTLVSGGYSPLEQYGGERAQGPWSDLYALCCTLFRIITGRPPSAAIARQQGTQVIPLVQSAQGRFSERFLSAIDRGLALEPGDRPQSVGEFRWLLGLDAQQPARPNGSHSRDNGQVRESGYSHPPAWRADGDEDDEPRSRWLGVSLVLLLLVGAGASAAYVLRPDWFPWNQNQIVVVQNPSPGGDDPPRPTLDEDFLLEDFDVTEEARRQRKDQIDGSLLAYTQNKEQLDTCIQSGGCPDQVTLLERVDEAERGYRWESGRFSGTIKVTRPRRQDCGFVLDVVEELRGRGLVKRQTRTYCTSNGLDRVMKAAGPVTN